MFTLTVTVADVPNSKGQVLLSLFKGEDGFPTNDRKAFLRKAVKAEGRNTVIQLEQLPEGTYAIAVFHDENSNGKLDTNFFGIPQESYGASNNVFSPFAPPKFKDASFVLKADKAITIYVKKFFQ